MNLSFLIKEGYPNEIPAFLCCLTTDKMQKETECPLTHGQIQKVWYRLSTHQSNIQPENEDNSAIYANMEGAE